MKTGLMGRKVGMTQIFTKNGARVPVTVIEIEPNTVVGIRTVEKDGYAAVQLGYGEAKEKHLTKAQIGHLNKAGVPLRRHLRELRLREGDAGALTVGAQLTVSMFDEGMLIDVTGITRGKGFQGVMRRHHMAGMRATHGTHEARRNPGSIGNRKTPGRTFKNTRLPGHMGQVRVTTQNLKVVEVDNENNLLLVRGTVPGARGTLITIRPAIKGQPKASA